MHATLTRIDPLELARLADDGCPNVADVSEQPERPRAAFVELLREARSAAKRRSFGRLPKRADSGPIRLW